MVQLVVYLEKYKLSGATFVYNFLSCSHEAAVIEKLANCACCPSLQAPFCAGQKSAQERVSSRAQGWSFGKWCIERSRSPSQDRHCLCACPFCHGAGRRGGRGRGGGRRGRRGGRRPGAAGR